MKQEQPPSSVIITIRLKTLNGTLYDFIVSPLRPICHLQPSIEQKTKVPIKSQRLLHKGIVLDQNMTLADYRIEDGDIVQLVANRIPSEVSHHSSIKRTERGNTFARQHARSKKFRQLQERVNGFRLRREESLQVVAQSKHVIEQLLECLNINFSADVVPFRLERRKVEVGQWVDVRDGSGQWVEGQVINQYGQYVLVHFNGWESKWNEWVASNSQRMAPFRTHTAQTTKSQYLSPTPTHQRSMPSQANPRFRRNIESISNDLPIILDSISALLKDMNFTLKQEYSLKNVSQMSFPHIVHNNSQQQCAIEQQQQEKGDTTQHQTTNIEQPTGAQFDTPNKQNIAVGDNISNKCEDDRSNKFDNDDVSSKSFKSKRSEGLVDTASMKSLVIEASRKRQNKVFFDRTEQAQSVRSVKQQAKYRQFPIMNQEYILEEQSQVNEELESRGPTSKGELRKRMKASQLAPLLDRVGRLFIDLAPHIALMGHTDQSNLTFSQNLSTKTNEGSLLSKLSAINQSNHQSPPHPIQPNLHSSQPSQGHINGGSSVGSRNVENCYFQVPLLLTPHEIDSTARLLQQQRRNLQNLS